MSATIKPVLHSQSDGPEVGLRSGQAGRHPPEESRQVTSVLLCLQGIEIHEFVPTTWIRTKVAGTSDYDFIEANNRLKSFVDNGEGVLVPEICYFAVRGSCKLHREVK